MPIGSYPLPIKHNQWHADSVTGSAMWLSALADYSNAVLSIS